MTSRSATVAFRTMLRLFASATGGASGLSEDVRRAATAPLSAAELADERAIHRIRHAMQSSSEAIHVVDFGAGLSTGQRPPERRVSDIYNRASAGPHWGRFLGALVRERRPTRVLELGTNLGISAAHMASALRRNDASSGNQSLLLTLEGAPELARLAEANLRALGHKVGENGRVQIVVGAFAETLQPACDDFGPFDLVFIDGHHEEQATLDYFQTIRGHLAPGAVVVLDDVEPLRPVWRAWRALLRAVRPPESVYLGRYGLFVYASDHETERVRPRLDTRDQQTAPVSYLVPTRRVSGTRDPPS